MNTNNVNTNFQNVNSIPQEKDVKATNYFDLLKSKEYHDITYIYKNEGITTAAISAIKNVGIVIYNYVLMPIGNAGIHAANFVYNKFYQKDVTPTNTEEDFATDTNSPPVEQEESSPSIEVPKPLTTQKKVQILSTQTVHTQEIEPSSTDYDYRSDGIPSVKSTDALSDISSQLQYSISPSASFSPLFPFFENSVSLQPSHLENQTLTSFGYRSTESKVNSYILSEEELLEFQINPTKEVIKDENLDSSPEQQEVDANPLGVHFFDCEDTDGVFPFNLFNDSDSPETPDVLNPDSSNRPTTPTQVQQCTNCDEPIVQEFHQEEEHQLFIWSFLNRSSSPRPPTNQIQAPAQQQPIVTEPHPFDYVSLKDQLNSPASGSERPSSPLTTGEQNECASQASSKTYLQTITNNATILFSKYFGKQKSE